jgi:hypothetical protein
MKRTISAAIAAILMVGLIASTALAAPATKYVAFGSATVTESPTGTFTIVSNGFDPVYTTSPEYGGVSISSKATSGKLIGAVTFSFMSSGDVAGGAPRFSIPINVDGKGNKTAFYAFLDVNGCAGATLVSTDSSTCKVFAGTETFANWAAFAAAHSSYKIASGSSPFIIADGTQGTYVVSDIVLR